MEEEGVMCECVCVCVCVCVHASTFQLKVNFSQVSLVINSIKNVRKALESVASDNKRP